MAIGYKIKADGGYGVHASKNSDLYQSIYGTLIIHCLVSSCELCRVVSSCEYMHGYAK